MILLESFPLTMDAFHIRLLNANYVTDCLGLPRPVKTNKTKFLFLRKSKTSRKQARKLFCTKVYYKVKKLGHV